MLLLTGCTNGPDRADSSCVGGALVHLFVDSVAIPTGSDDPYRDHRLVDYPETAERELDLWP